LCGVISAAARIAAVAAVEEEEDADTAAVAAAEEEAGGEHLPFDFDLAVAAACVAPERAVGWYLRLPYAAADNVPRERMVRKGEREGGEGEGRSYRVIGGEGRKGGAIMGRSRKGC